MVSFGTPPSDGELQSFADPDGTPPYVRLNDDGTTLTAIPRAFPMWFVWGSLLLPAAVGYAAIIWENPFKDPDPLWRFLWLLFALLIPVAVIGTGLLIGAILKTQVRSDCFFVLDRAAGTLTLPRVGVTLRPGDVVELVEVRDTHWKWAGDGWHGDYILELSVLAHGPGGTLIRYPVLAAGYARPVRRVAAELAELFGVARRKLTRPVFFGSWRREV